MELPEKVKKRAVGLGREGEWGRPVRKSNKREWTVDGGNGGVTDWVERRREGLGGRRAGRKGKDELGDVSVKFYEN